MNRIRNNKFLLLLFIGAMLYSNLAIAQAAEKINFVTFSGMSLFKTGGSKWVVADSVRNKPVQNIIETSRDENTIHLLVEGTQYALKINIKPKTITIPDYDSTGLKVQDIKLSGWSDQLVCNGWTVNEVKTNVGSFYKEKENKWIETDVKGTTIGHFTETNRDDWSVYLLKNDGNELRIDLYLKSTFFIPKGGNAFELYKLTGWLNDVKSTGYTVNMVKTASHSFFKSKDSTWVSADAGGQFKEIYYEKHRDDSSVLLKKGNAIQLLMDVKNKKLTYHQPDSTTKTIEYSLTDWSNDIADNGLTINQVAADKILFFATRSPGKWVFEGGNYRWVDKTWIETDANKKPFSYFSEISRSIHSIVLKKDDGLVLRISLPDKMIYSQMANNKEKPQFVISSLSREEFVNGWTVKAVTYSNGTFLQTEGKKWVELKADKKETGYFTEVNRDEWSVYLLKDDGNELRIDLFLKSTFFTPKGKSPFELYKLTGWSNR